MRERCLPVLKHRGPRRLLCMSQRLSPELAAREGVREHLGDLRKREGLMQYPQFQHQGWPIGSGMVESANKLVVEARLKGAGMHWERSHVNPLLAWRHGVCHQRGQETWHLAGSPARKLQALRRSKRALRWAPRRDRRPGRRPRTRGRSPRQEAECWSDASLPSEHARAAMSNCSTPGVRPGRISGAGARLHSGFQRKGTEAVDP